MYGGIDDGGARRRARADLRASRRHGGAATGRQDDGCGDAARNGAVHADDGAAPRVLHRAKGAPRCEGRRGAHRDAGRRGRRGDAARGRRGRVVPAVRRLRPKARTRGPRRGSPEHRLRAGRTREHHRGHRGPRHHHLRARVRTLLRRQAPEHPRLQVLRRIRPQPLVLQGTGGGVLATMGPARGIRRLSRRRPGLPVPPGRPGLTQEPTHQRQGHRHLRGCRRQRSIRARHLKLPGEHRRLGGAGVQARG